MSKTKEEIDDIKALVRNYFIENYNGLTHHHEIKVAHERAERYQELLRMYLFLVEFNECRCFNGPDDILSAMNLHSNQDKEYILNGVVTYQKGTPS